MDINVRILSLDIVEHSPSHWCHIGSTLELLWFVLILQFPELPSRLVICRSVALLTYSDKVVHPVCTVITAIVQMMYMQYCIFLNTSATHYTRMIITGKHSISQSIEAVLFPMLVIRAFRDMLTFLNCFQQLCIKFTCFYGDICNRHHFWKSVYPVFMDYQFVKYWRRKPSFLLSSDTIVEPWLSVACFTVTSCPSVCKCFGMFIFFIRKHIYLNTCVFMLFWFDGNTCMEVSHIYATFNRLNMAIFTLS